MYRYFHDPWLTVSSPDLAYPSIALRRSEPCDAHCHGTRICYCALHALVEKEKVNMHVLHRLAKTTLLNSSNCAPEGTNYDFAAGVWLRDGQIIALDPDNQVCSKKADIETGEDQKGQ